jgi:hypothetical protein
VAATPRARPAIAETDAALVDMPPFVLPLLALAVFGVVGVLVWSRVRAERGRP